jgi:hypothetical protein
VDADEFTNPTRCSSTRIGRCLNGTDITTDKDRYIARADVFLTDQLNIRGLYHGIGGLNGTDKTLGLDHSECF